MNPTRIMGWASAFVLFVASAGRVEAGWHNVFQVCCNNCGRGSVSYYAAPAVDPCCNPCPQVCTTRYVQRCYYQPVTTMETRSYYEAVTTYRTSYYYEPVTTCRYVSYYDPCTCSYYQAATPAVSYQLRAQSCPVQSWVQRCYYQPVVSYRQSSYWEPVTSCCNPCAPAAPVAAPPPAVSGTPEPPPAAQPGVGEGRIQPQAPAPPPGVRETRSPNGSGSPLYDQHFRSPAPNTTGSSLRPQPQALPVRPPNPVPLSPPKVKLEQIVSLEKGVKVASASDSPVWTPKR